MKKLETVLTYEQWLIQEHTKVSLPSCTEATKYLVEALARKEGFSDTEKIFFYFLKESNMSIFQLQEEMLNEGFLQKLSDWGKDMIDKGKEAIRDVKDWAGKEIEGVPEFFKALSSGVKSVAEMIANLFSKILESILPDTKTAIVYAKKALGSTYGEIENKTKEAAKKSPNTLKKEVPGFLEIVKATPKALSPKRLSEKFNDAMQKADSEKVKDSDLSLEESIQIGVISIFTEAVNLHSVDEIREGLAAINSISEGDHSHDHSHGHTKIPFVSTLSGFIEKVPPFSWLSKIAEYLGEKSNEFLNYVSESYTKANLIEEKVEFTLMGSLVGIGLETLVKGGAKSALLYFFPVLKSALTLVGAIATGIAIIHIASGIIDGLKEE